MCAQLDASVATIAQAKGAINVLSDEEACAKCVTENKQAKATVNAMGASDRLLHFKVVYTAELFANCSRTFPSGICKRCETCILDATETTMSAVMALSDHELCSSISGYSCSATSGSQLLAHDDDFANVGHWKRAEEDTLKLLQSERPIAAKQCSDARLKTDVTRVGTSGQGVPIYTWRYKAGTCAATKYGTETLYRGTMAQDLLTSERFASAVSNITDSECDKGMMTVDYSRLDVTFEIVA